MSHRSRWKAPPPLRHPPWASRRGPTSPRPPVRRQGRRPPTLHALCRSQRRRQQKGWWALQPRPHRLGNRDSTIPPTRRCTTDSQLRGRVEMGEASRWNHHYQHLWCADGAYGWLDQIEYPSGACPACRPGSYWSAGSAVLCSVRILFPFWLEGQELIVSI